MENNPGKKNHRETPPNNLEKPNSVNSLTIFNGFTDRITIGFFDRFAHGFHD